MKGISGEWLGCLPKGRLSAKEGPIEKGRLFELPLGWFDLVDLSTRRSGVCTGLRARASR